MRAEAQGTLQGSQYLPSMALHYLYWRLFQVETLNGQTWEIFSGEIHAGAPWPRDLVQRLAQHRVQVSQRSQVGALRGFTWYFQGLSKFHLTYSQVGRNQAWIGGASTLCQLSHFLRSDQSAEGGQCAPVQACEWPLSLLALMSTCWVVVFSSSHHLITFYNCIREICSFGKQFQSKIFGYYFWYKYGDYLNEGNMVNW